MRPLRERTGKLTACRPSDLGWRLTDTQEGEPAIQVGDAWLHSRYHPLAEARRLVDRAALDVKRPVVVVGLGLGYHVDELLRRGVEVVVLEPDPRLADLVVSLRAGNPDDPLLAAPVVLGEPGALEDTPGWSALLRRAPQTWVYPPTGRLHPAYTEAVCVRIKRAALAAVRLNVAVVGPMYGGTLPMVRYMVRALESLGHRPVLVDNAAGWPLHQAMAATVRSGLAAGQLRQILVRFLEEWTVARVLESAPEICLVLAQAPVGVGFAERMRREHVLTGYWFVENWRHMDYWSEIAPAYDYFFHIQPGDFEERLDEVGCRFHAHIPTGCDPGIHRPVVLSEQERDEFTCAVSFAGAGYPNRNRLLSGLTDYDLRIWGVNWTVRELAPFVRRPDETYTPEFFAKIVAGSAVNLNLHSSTAHPGVDPDADAVNPRVFEIASCGGFQVCDPCQGLDRLFEFGSELPVYRDLSELRALLDHYLPRESERRAIADRARARALAEHTYTHRLSAMLERIVDAHGDRLFAKGIRTQHTVGEMLERIDRDSSLAAYLATLPPDIPFTQDAIAERLGASDPSARCEAEDILAFLRSMRATTEALLDGREYRPK